MKSSPALFPQAYLLALRRHLRQGRAALPPAAGQLGRRALKNGLKTSDLAHVHSEALTQLLAAPAPLRPQAETIRQAGLFFAGVLTPLEESHRNGQEANLQLKSIIATLHQRTAGLAAASRRLIGEIFHREGVEESLRSSGQTCSGLLVQSRRLQGELRDLSRRLLSVQEAERKRISRELHDVIGQSLTGITLHLAALKSRTAIQNKELSQGIRHTQLLVEQSVALVHRFATDLRPSVLDDLGLIPALHAYVIASMERSGIRVDLTATAGVEQATPAVKTVLYRIVQESLTNVAQHSQASRATIRIAHAKGKLRLEITDHGTGFPLEKVMAAGSNQRLGLLGMRERVEMAGGTFEVKSSRGSGTVVRVEFPHLSRRQPVRKTLSPDGKSGQQVESP